MGANRKYHSLSPARHPASMAGADVIDEGRAMTQMSRDDRASVAAPFIWPHDDTMRVPYQVYTDPELYALEQQRLFRGATWNFLGLEAEIPIGGDYKTTQVGDTPVVMVRKMDGGIS